ncbi:MBL fold metallo-hydrolase [Archangium violaceum]|uniref:MBL fold metallo-hydrolase n=1 Tax=Archangium violaceum TaxID=83451 RepID=UPI00194F306B|nr:MBL fold metallo-hydrolase [Archangium violaceum]QRN93526.1 MBL fold metallo-hydrolase [Archangium violaceum]
MTDSATDTRNTSAAAGFSRRQALGLAAAGVAGSFLSCESAPAANAAQPRRSADRRFFRHRVGRDLELLVLDDGFVELPAANYALGVPAAQWQPLLQEAGLPVDVVRSQISPVLVRSRDRLVLLDTGFGALPTPDGRRTAGHLQASLRAAGYRPEDVDTIVISHASADHLGGLINSERELAFPEAQIVFAREEWDFWREERPTPNLDEGSRAFFLTFTRQIFPLIERRVLLVDRDVQLARGVNVAPLLGHTPGHIGLQVQSDGQRVILSCDALAHHVLSFRHPEWRFLADVEPEHTVAVRRAILQEASDRSDTLLHGYHFPFPGLGRVRSIPGGGFVFDPVRLQ